MRIHFLIVGQGLAGSLIAYHLLKKGKKVRVIDLPKDNTSSKVAAGLYNPITGHRMVKTWMADELFPFLEAFYLEMEAFLKTTFVFKKQIFRPFESISEQNEWFSKSAEPNYKPYVKAVGAQQEINEHYTAPYGGLFTQISGYIHTVPLLKAFTSYLKEKELLLEEQFHYQELNINSNYVEYRGLTADKIVFCEGVGNAQNPFFNYLPINATKGQLLDIEIGNYKIDSIVNKGVFILPKVGFQTVGSNYEWNFEDDLPSEKGRIEIEGKLAKILTSPYEILGQRAGVRPTVKDHRPLLGRHPELSNVCIFNGMGTKGISLAPYFSSHFVSCILEGRSFMPEADIRRFDYLYQSK